MPWVTKVISMFQPYTKQGQGMAYLINFLKKVVDARCKQSTPAVSEKQPTIVCTYVRMYMYVHTYIHVCVRMSSLLFHTLTPQFTLLIVGPYPDHVCILACVLCTCLFVSVNSLFMPICLHIYRVLHICQSRYVSLHLLLPVLSPCLCACTCLRCHLWSVCPFVYIAPAVDASV